MKSKSVSRRKVPYKLNEIGLVAASLSRDLCWNRRIRAAFDIGLSRSRAAWERMMRLKGKVAVITGAPRPCPHPFRFDARHHRPDR